jgi:small subunit ribosomal protein S6
VVAVRDANVLEEQHVMADRQYELVYILPPDTTETQVAELHTQVEGVVARLKGHIEKTENWGRKRLAYEIGHNKEGVYVLDVINGSGELMKELDRRLRVMDQVIRHMVVRVDEEKKVVDRTRTKRQSESERRRVKRGLPPVRQPGEGRSTETDDGDDDRFDGGEV